MIAIQPKSRQLLGVNQQAYQALKASMSLNLRRQLLIAVCDDVRMQNQLATQLENDLAQSDRALAGLPGSNGVSNGTRLDAADTETSATALRLERLMFDPEEGNLPQQVAQWVRHTMLSEGSLPKLQVLGIEQMIHQPAITQNYFLRSLEKIEALLPRLNTSLLIWVPWPWLRTIQQSSPTFWNWRNGVFEFVSEPTPTPLARNAFRLELPMPASEDNRSDNRPENRLENRPEDAISNAQSPSRLAETIHPEGGSADSEHPLRSSANGTSSNGTSSNGTSSDSSLYGEMPGERARAAERLRHRPLDIALAPFQDDFPIPDVAEAETVARERSLAEAMPLALADPTVPVSEDFTRDTELQALLSTAGLNELKPAAEEPAEKEPEVEPAGKEPDEEVFQDIFSLGGLHSIVSRGVNVPRPVKTVEPESMAALDAIADDLTATDDWIDDDLADVSLSDTEFDSLGWDDFVGSADARADEQADDAEQKDVPRESRVYSAEEKRQQASEYFATGMAYRTRIESGERNLDIIEPAIAAYESGLRCMSEPHPDWITGLNDLGTLYWLKAQQQEDTKQAVVFMTRSIHLYEEALSKIQASQAESALELQPGIIGQLYSNMGAVYTVLATCEDPLTYLKSAAETYNRALPMISLETHPEEYATLQNSLGSVFWKLSHYDSAAAYLHQAIAAYNEALLGYHPHQKPLDYASVQNNLGITYWSLAKQERPEFLLKHAIAAYRDALNYRTPDVDPSACAISYNNLALAYWDLAKYTQGDIAQKSRYQKNAVTAFEAALNISKLSGALNAMDSAAIYHCLGDVHAQMIETAPSRADIAISLQKSLYSYIKAIEGLPTDAPAYPGRFTAVVANLKLHYDKLGLDGQQAALNRVPPALLPQVMMAL